MRSPRPIALSCLLGGTLVAAVSACPGVAAATEGESADSLAKEARSLYDQGRFEQAVAAYLKAYRQSPSAGYLYNVAVIYDRKLNEPGLAMDFYRRYIVADDADPAAVERATARIKALKSVPVAEPVPAEPPAPTSRAAATPPGDTAAAPPPRTSEGGGGGSGRKIAAFTLIGVGGAALVGGVVLGVVASSVADKYATADNATDKKNLQSLGRSEALAADILMGGGVLMAGVGTVLLLTGGGDATPAAAPSAEAEAEGALGFGVVPLPGGAGFTLGGTL